MNPKRVTVSWRDGEWAVDLKPGTEVLVVHRLQRDATREARDYARQNGMPLVIYDRHGDVRETADYSSKTKRRRASRAGGGRPVTVGGRRGTTLA